MNIKSRSTYYVCHTWGHISWKSAEHMKMNFDGHKFFCVCLTSCFQDFRSKKYILWMREMKWNKEGEKKPQKEAAVSRKMFFFATHKKSSLFCGKQKEIKAIDHFNFFFFFFRNIQQTNSITLFDGNSSRQKLCRFA